MAVIRHTLIHHDIFVLHLQHRLWYLEPTRIQPGHVDYWLDCVLCDNCGGYLQAINTFKVLVGVPVCGREFLECSVLCRVHVDFEL